MLGKEGMHRFILNFPTALQVEMSVHPLSLLGSLLILKDLSYLINHQYGFKLPFFLLTLVKS